MKQVWIKTGLGKTSLVSVPDDWQEGDSLPDKDLETGDLTTGHRKPLSLGISKERYDDIFNKGAN